VTDFIVPFSNALYPSSQLASTLIY